jgi:hypothetical protein
LPGIRQSMFMLLFTRMLVLWLARALEKETSLQTINARRAPR